MKGKKCFGLLLALSIIFGLSLNVFSDVSAIQNLNVTANNFVINGSTTTTNQRNTLIPSNNSFYRLTILPNSTIDSTNYNRLRLFFSFSGNVGPFDSRGLISACGYIGSNDRNISVVSSQYEPMFYDVVYPGNYFYDDANRPATSNSVEIGMCSYELVLDISQVTYINSVDLTGDFLRVFHTELDSDGNLNYVAGGGSANGNINLYLQAVRMQLFNDESAKSQEEMNKKDEQDRNNMESQQSDVSSDSDSSQESAESTGTTLLSAFTGFVSAITSASPSNCNLDMDLGNLDLGVVNLCQLSLPQPLPTIASIMLILFCVPLSIATARKVISLFRSFQG